MRVGADPSIIFFFGSSQKHELLIIRCHPSKVGRRERKKKKQELDLMMVLTTRTLSKVEDMPKEK